ncbi:NAD(P)/FAD-dependent oxidoreductase [Streptomyces spirodelae]|uniref:NAD(P)/FAD-dependent oxidoreductase n=1 Tax=Streptomyces spirodelae TaxID=2812904 RepID=UPI0027DAEC7E|nr:FAD-dependent oxidoreductase [Streptomyces spirodelae]
MPLDRPDGRPTRRGRCRTLSGPPRGPGRGRPNRRRPPRGRRPRPAPHPTKKPPNRCGPGWRRAAADPHAGEVTTLDAAEARRLSPALGHSGGGFQGTALHLSGGARLDGRRLQAALVAAAERHGLRTLSGTASLEARDGRVHGVRVAGELVSADAVVAAAGAWSPALLGPAGVHIDVVPQRGQIVHLRLPGSDTSDWPVVLPSGSGHYLLTFDDSRVVVGATREDGTGFDHRVTAGGLAEVLRHALAVAPGLAGATHLETRAASARRARTGSPCWAPSPRCRAWWSLGAPPGRRLGEASVQGA